MLRSTPCKVANLTKVANRLKYLRLESINFLSEVWRKYKWEVKRGLLSPFSSIKIFFFFQRAPFNISFKFFSKHFGKFLPNYLLFLLFPSFNNVRSYTRGFYCSPPLFFSGWTQFLQFVSICHLPNHVKRRVAVHKIKLGKWIINWWKTLIDR